MNSFTNIDINLIHAHQDNPRKDLGDLTELAESVKARGILQNLTVVPQEPGYCTSCQLYNGGIGKCTENHDKNERPPCSKWASKGHFTVVIGHRRLAAAKLAGLTAVPCVISDIDYKDQIATMLLENIQRSDLTPIEQAQGFQMMMDLGETVAGISDKTGFSDSTIRKRLNLAKLDQDKLQESYLRGGTLMDYTKLEQLKDDKAKNEVLEYIGTNNFNWQLERAINEQEKPERKKKLLEFLDTFAKKIKTASEIKGGASYETCFHGYQLNNGYKKPKDASKAEYFYTVDTYGANLYKKVPKADKKELSSKEKDYNRREAELKKLSKQAYELRYEFVKSFSAGRKFIKEINEFVFQRLLEYGYPEPSKMFEILGVESSDTKDMDYEAQELRRNLLAAKYKEAPECSLFKVAYARMNDSSNKGYFYTRKWESSISYEKNRDLNIIYDILVDLGYEMSDEEKQLRDGSHELFDKSEETV